MKLRIKGNSIRVRLTQSEVERLAAGQRIEQQTHFSATARLDSSVESSPAAKVPAASFNGTQIALVLPMQQVRQWAASDQVSIEALQPTGDAEPLRILVEKDFQCLHSHAEGIDDAFPNPAVSHA